MYSWTVSEMTSMGKISRAEYIIFDIGRVK
jgi:hypothetical protein